MNHQYIDVCFTKEQAAFCESEHRQLQHHDISTIEVASISLSEAQSDQPPYDFQGKYYKQSVQGTLFIVMAQAA